jgi:hypothetical protein
MVKTATGLLFHELGRLISPNQVEIPAIEHAHNVHPLAMIEQAGPKSHRLAGSWKDRSLHCAVSYRPTCPNGACTFQISSSTCLSDAQAIRSSPP